MTNSNMIQSFYLPDNTLILIQWICLFRRQLTWPFSRISKANFITFMCTQGSGYINKSKWSLSIVDFSRRVTWRVQHIMFVASPNNNRPQRHHTCAASFHKYFHMMKLTLLEASWEQAHGSQFKPSIHWTLILYNGRMTNWLLFIFWKNDYIIL